MKIPHSAWLELRQYGQIAALHIPLRTGTRRRSLGDLLELFKARFRLKPDIGSLFEWLVWTAREMLPLVQET